MPLLIHRHHPDRDHVADRDDVIGTLDVAIGHLTDVHQAAVFEADVHESAEIHHVEHGPLQFHGRLQIFELENALFENRRRQVLTRVSAWSSQGLDNVIDRRQAELQALADFFR